MANDDIYQRLWNKYMPVIRLKLKEAVRKREVVSFGLNKTDFELLGKKGARHTFTLEINEGRSIGSLATSPVARDLLVMMKEDSIVKQIIKGGHFKMTMGKAFELIITCIEFTGELPQVEAVQAKTSAPSN
jgi:hypothetical protein